MNGLASNTKEYGQSSEKENLHTYGSTQKVVLGYDTQVMNQLDQETDRARNTLRESHNKLSKLRSDFMMKKKENQELKSQNNSPIKSSMHGSMASPMKEVHVREFNELSQTKERLANELSKRKERQEAEEAVDPEKEKRIQQKEDVLKEQLKVNNSLKAQQLEDEYFKQLININQEENRKLIELVSRQRGGNGPQMVDELVRQQSQAKETMEMLNEERKKNNLMMLNKAQEEERMNAEIRNLNQTVQRLSQENSQLKMNGDSSRGMGQGPNQEEQRALREAIVAANQKRDQAERELMNAKNEIQSLKDNLGSNARRVEQMERDLNNARVELSQARSTQQGGQFRNETINPDLMNIKNELNLAKDAVLGANRRAEQSERELSNFKYENSQLKDQMQAIMRRNEQNEKDLQAARNELNQNRGAPKGQEDLEGMRRIIDSRDNEIMSLKKNILSLESQRQSNTRNDFGPEKSLLNEQIDNLRRENTELKRKVDQANGALDQLNRETMMKRSMDQPRGPGQYEIEELENLKKQLKSKNDVIEMLTNDYKRAESSRQQVEQELNRALAQIEEMKRNPVSNFNGGKNQDTFTSMERDTAAFGKRPYETKGMEDEMRRLRDQNSEMEAQLRNAQQTAMQLKQEREKSEAKLNEREREVAGLQREIDQLGLTNKKMRDELSSPRIPNLDQTVLRERSQLANDNDNTTPRKFNALNEQSPMLVVNPEEMKKLDQRLQEFDVYNKQLNRAINELQGHFGSRDPNVSMSQNLAPNNANSGMNELIRDLGVKLNYFESVTKKHENSFNTLVQDMEKRFVNQGPNERNILKIIYQVKSQYENEELEMLKALKNELQSKNNALMSEQLASEGQIEKLLADLKNSKEFFNKLVEDLNQMRESEGQARRELAETKRSFNLEATKAKESESKAQMGSLEISRMMELQEQNKREIQNMRKQIEEYTQRKR